MSPQSLHTFPPISRERGGGGGPGPTSPSSTTHHHRGILGSARWRSQPPGERCVRASGILAPPPRTIRLPEGSGKSSVGGGGREQGCIGTTKRFRWRKGVPPTTSPPCTMVGEGSHRPSLLSLGPRLCSFMMVVLKKKGRLEVHPTPPPPE